MYNTYVTKGKAPLKPPSEVQVRLLNWKKNGEAFYNLVSVIPVPEEDGGEVVWLVGFQVDLAVQPVKIAERVRGGRYFVGENVGVFLNCFYYSLTVRYASPSFPIGTFHNRFQFTSPPEVRRTQCQIPIPTISTPSSPPATPAPRDKRRPHQTPPQPSFREESRTRAGE